MTTLIGVIPFFAAFLAYALFAGYETGFVSADRLRVRRMSEEGNNPRARSLLGQFNNPDYRLVTILVGTDLALVIACVSLLTTGLPAWGVGVIALVTFVVGAEIIPKSVFRRYPDRLSLTFLPVLRLFDFLLSPLVIPCVLALRGLRRLANTRTHDIDHALATEEDFRHLVDVSAARGSFQANEQELIHSIIDLQTTQAKEIMVPRTNMDALPETASRDELIQVFLKTGKTRIPIYRETIDTVIGVANVYDVLIDDEPDREDITRFIKEVMHVPDTVIVADLLQELKKARYNMTIITDEYGGTDGLVTLEDTLEEIFGEIHDEHDEAMALIRQVGPNGYVVSARMPLEDVSEYINVQIEDEEVETIGGWVMRYAGRIPAQGEKLKFGGFRVTVLEGQSNQIHKIRLDVLPETREQSEQVKERKGN